MSRDQSPIRAKSSFSGGTRSGTVQLTPRIGGCEYATPHGRCLDHATEYTVGGVAVTVCGEHLEAILEENGLGREDVAR